MDVIIAKLILIVFLFSYTLFLLSLYDARLVVKGKTVLVFFAGALMFIFVFLVQNPIQSLIVDSGLLTERNYVLGVTTIALIAGFFQEFLKIVPALSDKWNLFTAAAAGAGFGFIGAMIMIIPHSSYSILEITEWLIIIAFQMAATVLIFYGFSKTIKTGVLFYVLISIIHTVAEAAVIFQKMRPMILIYTVIVLFVITLPLFFISVKKYKDALL